MTAGVKVKKDDLVLCEWEDSYGCSSRWQAIEPHQEPRGMTCKSVGWIVRMNKRFIVIVPHMSTNEDVAETQGCGDMTIPAASIVRLKKIRLS